MMLTRLIFLFAVVIAGSFTFADVDDYVVVEKGRILFDMDRGALPVTNEAWLRAEFVTQKSWKSHPLREFEGMIERLSGGKLLPNKKMFGLVVKTAGVVDRSVSILTKERFLTPSFHIDANKTIQLRHLGLDPLGFEALISVFGKNLWARMFIGYLDALEVKNESEIDSSLSSDPDTVGFEPQRHAVTVRWTSSFNAAIDRVASATEYFDIGKGRTLAVSHIFVGIHKTWYTWSFGRVNPLAASKMRELFRQSYLENFDGAANIEVLLGINANKEWLRD